MVVKPQEAFNFYSHLFGALAAALGVVFLVQVASYSTSSLTTALIYGLSVVALFSASSLYHAFKKEENEISIWRKFDRFAIFLMIAGSSTPICYFFLDDNWRWPMIGLQWGLVGFGLISQIFFPRAPRKFYAVLYMSMGWVLVLGINQIVSSMTVTQVYLLLGGGVAFSIGGIIYAIKKPMMLPGVFSFHELFHVMVLIGGGLHYGLIYSAYAANV